MGRYSPEFLTKMKHEPMSLNFIKQAIHDRAILEGKVIRCSEDYTLTLKLGRDIFGEIPFSELEVLADGAVAKFVSATSKLNKHIKFIPKELVENEDGTYTVKCSRKEAQQECIDNYIKKLIPGDVIDAKVLRVVKYGVFCDIGCGITALLPTNNISVTHVVNPETVLRGVSRLRVVVQYNNDPLKVQLTHRELLGTWEEESSKFSIGDTVPGTVLSVEDYGIFVRISQNLSGLAEISELHVETDDMVLVKIIDIKPENMKVKLVITERIEYDTPEDANNARRMRFDYVIKDNHITDWEYNKETAKKHIASHF